MRCGRRAAIRGSLVDDPEVQQFNEDFPRNADWLFVNLPLVFESNQGQSDSQVQFLARGSGYGLFLTQNEAVLALQESAGQTSVVRMSLDGVNTNSQGLAMDPLPGKSNYLIGNDPAKWHRNVPSFFTFDDHELVNDIYASGEAGQRDRRSVFRDIGVYAWGDNLGWAVLRRAQPAPAAHLREIRQEIRQRRNIRQIVQASPRCHRKGAH